MLLVCTCDIFGINMAEECVCARDEVQKLPARNSVLFLKFCLCFALLLTAVGGFGSGELVNRTKWIRLNKYLIVKSSDFYTHVCSYKGTRQSMTDKLPHKKIQTEQRKMRLLP